MLAATVVTGTALAADGGTIVESEGETFTASVPLDDGAVDVSVSVPAGALPDGVTLEAELVGDTEAVAGTLDEAGVAHDGLLALDVRFVDADGAEVEPSESVDVSFSLPASALGDDVDASSIAVSHLSEDADGNVSSVDTVADAGDESDGTIAVDGDTDVSSDTDVSAAETVTADFLVDSFSTFTIRWSSGNTTYFNVTVHYVDEDGNEIDGTQTSNITVSGVSDNHSVSYTFSDYAGDIDGYTYSEARYGSYDGDTITRMDASQNGNYNRTRYLTFYNGNTQVHRLTRGNNGGTQTADVYLVYTANSTSGGDEGTSTVSATVTTGKTAVLDEDTGDYDLTLSISGDRGTVEDPAKLDVVIVVDKSGSMAYDMGNDSGSNRGRMQAVVDAVSSLTKALEGNDAVDVQYNLITFSSLSYTKYDRDTGWTTDASKVNSAVSYFTEESCDRWGCNFEHSLEGGTNYEYAFYKANQELSSARSDAEQVVIFLTDGVPTHRGTSSWDETRDDNNRNYENTNAATALLSGMNADTFYAIGIGSSFTSGAQDSTTNGRTNLNRVVSAAQQAGMTSSLYTTQSSSELVDIFEKLAGSMTFFAAKDVTISDQLSDYADIVLTDGSPRFTITVTRAAYADSAGTQHNEQTWTTTTPVGNNGSLTFQNAEGKDVKVTASYDSLTKTIKLVFPDDYELEEGYTYSISTVITPSDKAKIEAAEGGFKYSDTPDSGTGTHANNNEKGFYSNGKAEVTYTANDESDSTAFPKPVIQVQEPDSVTVSGLTVVKAVEGADASANAFEFTITPVATGDDETAVNAQDEAEKAGWAECDTSFEGVTDDCYSTTSGEDAYMLTVHNPEEIEGGQSSDVHKAADEVEFTSDDVGKTFKYVYEENTQEMPSGWHLTSGTSKWTVLVTVTDERKTGLTATVDVYQGDESNGVLYATYTYTAGVENPAVSASEGVDASSVDQLPTIRFTNTYVAPATSLPLTGGDMTGLKLLLAGGTLGLLGVGVWLLSVRRRNRMTV